MRIVIERFKSIEEAHLDLERINVLVGGNNAGKSSVIQAIQFAVGCAQTTSTLIPAPRWSSDQMSPSLFRDDLFYSPIKDWQALGYGNQRVSSDEKKAIRVTFNDGEDRETVITLRAGKNRNIATRFIGALLGEELRSLDNPFSIYVTGLAGIPFEEEYRAFGSVRRAAARGDCNSIFRNILLHLSRKPDEWKLFIESMQTVFPEIDVRVSCDQSNTALVIAEVSLEKNKWLPIDAMGTGMLQAAQIAAYIFLFHPRLLLLDEPDSHLHPNNQIAIAQMLDKVVSQSKTNIIMTTHSRTLISALRNNAKFLRMKDGTVTDSPFDEFATLLELGALDDFDKLKNGQYRFVVLTEDTTPESQKMLHLILQGSGLAQTEYKMYSYPGSSNLVAAEITAEFMCELHPDLKVILHTDRDGRSESEWKNDTTSGNERILRFITKYNDIEGYFCTVEHVQEVLQAGPYITNGLDVGLLISQVREAKKTRSIQVMTDNRWERSKRRTSPGTFSSEAQSDYESNPLIFGYTKEIRSSVAGELQKIVKMNVDLIVATNVLVDDRVADFVQAVV